ncbi:6823_t:CDS:2 [Cetraspora pellucida]|uniref:6823_t:CDS:1 n=1 Tax=Cetraspora pellucida TaxID=1433469 RepID=A0ACA9LAC5_9GLOM|nr:6823_t:CDS:2 [Cetraspora pellucida]
MKIVKNPESSLSSEAFSTIRQRRRPSVSNIPVSGTNSTNQDRKKLLNRLAVVLLLFAILTYFVKIQFKQNIPQSNEGLNMENIVNIFDTGSKKLSSLEIPETNEINKYRINVRDLGVIMKKSDIIVQNGKLISEVLFELDKEIQAAGKEIEEFRHQAKNFLWSLADEVNSITEEIERVKQFEEHLFNRFIGLNSQLVSTNLLNFIRERLKVIEKQIPGLQNQLKHVISSISKFQHGASSAHEYLIDGEREAEQALKKHWLGEVIDYNLRRRAESELVHVQCIIKLLREIAPSLINFETFLNEYHRKIQDVGKEVHHVRSFAKITTESIKYLRKAVTDLEKQNEKFSSAEKQIGHKPMDSYYFDDIINSRNRDCTEFHALIEKPNKAHLKKIRIWSSDIVNAIAFFYSDDTSAIYGTPGDGDPYDFDWHKDEKIKNMVIRIGSVLYAIQFQTDQGRVSDMCGGEQGNAYYVHAGDNIPVTVDKTLEVENLKTEIKSI